MPSVSDWITYLFGYSLCDLADVSASLLAKIGGTRRPFDTKLVLCRIILMSSNQPAPLRGAESGAPRAGLCALGRPPGAPAPSQPLAAMLT